VAADGDIEMEFESDSQLRFQKTQSMLCDTKPFFDEGSSDQIASQQESEELLLEDEFIKL